MLAHAAPKCIKTHAQHIETMSSSTIGLSSQHCNGWAKCTYQMYRCVRSNRVCSYCLLGDLTCPASLYPCCLHCPHRHSLASALTSTSARPPSMGLSPPASTLPPFSTLPDPAVPPCLPSRLFSSPISLPSNMFLRESGTPGPYHFTFVSEITVSQLTCKHGPNTS